ncbi:hypothetical protein DMA11_19190 [Marinilabiliaceae bacterium JC017]|nr:hypothetical protein DMA11_19190 [Marinilabiliaceae bacterium JC017]
MGNKTITFFNKLDKHEGIGIKSLITAGLEYEDHDKDGQMDNKRIEDELPEFCKLLKSKTKKSRPHNT